MNIERIVELEQFIEREMKGNEALTNDAGCVARAKIDRDILVCLKELKDYREAWDKVDENITARHLEANYRHVDENWFCGIYDALNIVRKLRPKDSKKEE